MRVRVRRSASSSSGPSALSPAGGVARIVVGPAGQRLALTASPRRPSPARRWDAAAGARAPGPRARRRARWRSAGRCPSAAASSPIDIGCARQPADRPRAAEAHAQRLGDLAPAGVVEHEVGHQQPDLACGVAGHARAVSLRNQRFGIELRRRAPRRLAGPRGWWPRRRAPARRAPQAASVHQAGWLADASSPSAPGERSPRRPPRRASGRPAGRSWRSPPRRPPGRAASRRRRRW